MRALLDSRVLLWLLATPDRVPDETRATLADRTTELIVSAASGLEIATKIRLGKLTAPGLLETWHRRLAEIGATELAITTEHALLAGSMQWQHRDPFDRLLVAQAISENLTLVTVDRALARLPAPRILTW